nr:2-C-methyl-D-erythritol 4-phosphate cytidylyltransferase [Bacteroides sp.]
MTGKICHIIVAAGSGSRFGAAMPKQFCLMAGRPVLMETIERMRRFGGESAGILLVVSADMEAEWLRMCAAHGFESPATVHGGASRWESVSHALSHPLAQEAEVITVHDGARPLLTRELLQRVTAVSAHGNIPVIEVTDSLRRIGEDGGSEAVDRSRYRAVQTPQAFRGELLRQAYALPFSPEFTDDASVMEAAGFTDLQLTEGDPRNIKITRPGDIDIAELYLSSMQ